MADYGYGLWFLVAVNSLVFIIFAASFFHPQSKRDWRALGGFSAFVIALFTEMSSRGRFSNGVWQGGSSTSRRTMRCARSFALRTESVETLR